MNIAVKDPQVYIEGQLHATDDDQSSQDHIPRSRSGGTMQMLSGRLSGSGALRWQYQVSRRAVEVASAAAGWQSVQRRRGRRSDPPAAPSNEPPMGFDDDIPFTIYH